MKTKINNYMKIKKLLYFAKQTFLDEKGVEIEPALEKLEIFIKELNTIIDLVDVLKDDIQKKPKT